MPGERKKTVNINKLKEKFNPLKEEMKKFPLAPVRERDLSKLYKTVKEKKRYDIMLSPMERLILKLISIAFAIEHRVPYVRKQAMKIMNDIKDEVVKSYLPFPPYSYAVLISASLFVALLLIPVFLFFLFLKLTPLALIAGVFMLTSFLFVGYLYASPKGKFSGAKLELLQILGVWYGISTTGMSPQEQFEAMYKILLEYRRLNLKYGNLYPKFKMFEIFHDIHYAMKYRNYSVVDAVESVITKIENDELKLFFMKILRAIKEQNDTASVIESEYFRLVQDVQMEIENSKETVSNMSEIYITIVSMFAGNLFVMMLVMGSMSSFEKMLSSMVMGILMTVATVVFASIGISVFMNMLFSSKRPRRTIPYNPVHAIFAFLSILTVIILPFIVGASNVAYLFLPGFIALLLSLPGYRNVKALKKQIKNSELDFAHRLHEVATQLSFGQTLPNAMLSTVLKVRGRITTFNDWIFYTIANYIKFGKTMKDLVDTIIVRIPSDLIRIPMTVIALVEEMAGKMSGVFENLSLYVSNVIDASEKVKGYIATIKMMSVVINVMSFAIVAYLLVMLLPSQLAIPFGSAMNGNLASNNFNVTQIGNQYISTYQQVSPIFFKLQNKIFPQTLKENTPSPIVVLGLASVAIYIFAIAFALSSAVFLVMLDENPTLPELAFYLSVFFIALTLVGYVTAFKNIYNPEQFIKSIKIIKAFQNISKSINAMPH